MALRSSVSVAQALEVVGTHLAEVEGFRIRGEIVHVGESDRGLWLTLADQDAVIALFVRAALIAPSDALRPGQVVEAKAVPRPEKKAGSKWYLLTASRVRVLGEVGPIAEQRTLATESLEAEGLVRPNAWGGFKFTPPRRAGFPTLNRVIILTAQKGAGWGDFKSQVAQHLHSGVIETRWIRVQGDGLVEDLTRELDQIGAGDADLVIVMRGGGGWADLRVFDDVRVARAVASAKLPVATAVGHASNISLTDLAASWAFITPSVAGEAVRAALWLQERRDEASRETRAEGPAARALSASKRAAIESLTSDLTREREHSRSARQVAMDLQARIRESERAYAEVWLFAEKLLFDAARSRIRTRSRWLSALGGVVGYLALLATNGGGVWGAAGLSGAVGAVGFTVYAWRGPRRAAKPASTRELRRAPKTLAIWFKRLQEVRTPREFRVLAAVRPRA